MSRRYLLPLFAVVGFGLTIAAVMLGNQSPPAAPASGPSAQAPVTDYVAGAGIIEASTENIAIGTPVSGVVTTMYVKWGDQVSAGAPLFKIDDRDLQGQLPVVVAKVQEAEEKLGKSKNLFKVGEGLSSGRSISEVELANRRFDVGMSEGALAAARAQVEQIKIEIDRRVVRAPVAGRVLQINTHVGEFAQSGVLSSPLMLFGDDSRLHVRADIDENDAWRVQATAPALGYIPGNPAIKTPLRFERIELYVVPKTSLTGASAERTDTRVLQVIYSFDHAALPIYVGQRMNVYIQAPPATSQGTAAQQPPENGPVTSKLGDHRP